MNKNFDVVYLTALRFLAHKPRTEAEVVQKLKRYLSTHPIEVDVGQSELIAQVIDLLKEEKFINDKEYVSQYSSTSLASGKRSSLFVKKFLLGKGISKDLVEDVLTEHKDNDRNTAKNLALKKYNILSDKKLPDRKIREKVITYLLGRGFKFEDASDAVDSIIGVK